MRRASLAVLLILTGCGSSGPGLSPDAGSSDAGWTDAGRPDAGTSDAGSPDAGRADAGPRDAGAPDAGTVPDGGTYRNSLSVCWTQGSCPRAMAMGHGGLWDAVSAPYLSNGAISAAFTGNMDAVKIDVRVTQDNVPVLAHSSPIQIYESVDCLNQTIETMTAAQVTACHRFPSTTETFQRLDDVLAYLRGKMVVQLTVKRSVDYARVIADVNAAGANDFAFMEILPSELQTLIPTLPGSGSVYYLISFGTDTSQIDAMLALHNPRAFMFEFDPTAPLASTDVTKLHAANVRPFSYDSTALASVAELQGLYTAGYDVVSSNSGANGVQARLAANQARGVNPP